jgi:hypothetical protein
MKIQTRGAPTPKPEPGRPLFTDEEGRSYEITCDDDCCEARVRHQGRRVGRVALVWQRPRLILAEIKIAPAHRGYVLGTAALEEIHRVGR